mgnify:FL=1
MSDVTCSIEGCTEPLSARGWCRKHYSRWYNHGDPLAGRPARTPPSGRCAVDGCTRKSRTKGLCSAHYDRWRRNGTTGEVRIGARNPGAECLVDECDRLSTARGFCGAHYYRWKTQGDAGDAAIMPVSKGRDIGYGAAHDRVRKLRGRASQYICTECGGPAQQWAYNHRDPDVIRAPMDALLGAGMLYSADPAFYQPMCKRCHSAFDAKHRDSIL